MKVKDISRTTQKYVTNAGQAGGAYADGVQNPKTDWQTATVAAAGNYKTAVTKAAAENRFAKGVNKAGTAKQQQNAMSKGTARYGPGVALGQADYAEAMAPVLKTLESIQLPPRGPKGDPNNLQRVGVPNAALHAMKVK